MDRRSVNNRVVPDGHVITNDALTANICVNRAIVLDAAPPSDPYSTHIATQHRVFPDAAAFTPFDIFYQSRTWREIRVRADLRLGSTELDQRHSKQSSFDSERDAMICFCT
jgi:hypothetical protein